eukprot:5586674-Prorocentrum_lima.AAC.1
MRTHYPETLDNHRATWKGEACISRGEIMVLEGAMEPITVISVKHNIEAWRATVDGQRWMAALVDKD